MRILAPAFIALVLSLPCLADPQSTESAAETAAAEEITVTGHRGLAIGQSALSSALLLPSEVRSAPARTADDALRSIAAIGAPRAGSSLQHPTAQSVSMRGVGGGRTLVLLDGVPVNDAFGGWIQWNKVPLSALQRVEAVGGGSANVYGNLAMGGVIQLFRAPASADRFRFDGEYGQLDTFRVSAEGTKTLGDSVSLTVLGHALRSSGAWVAAPELRGPIDEPEPFQSQNASARVDLRLSDQLTAFASAGYFAQAGTAGTALSGNSLWIADGAGGFDLHFGPDTLLSGRLFGSDQRYHNVNTRIATGRASESIAVLNEVPASRVGGSLLWSRRFQGRHAVTLGVDAQHASAENHDALYDAQGTFTGNQRAGGRQLLAGVFGEWAFTPIPALTTTAGVRGDLWDNSGGFSVSAAGVATSLPEKRAGAVTPRLSAVLRVSPDVAVRAAAYSGFRAPNLNELYRGFISNGVATLPNSSLGAERLLGAEAGADLSPARNLRLGITGYLNALYDVVQTVTLDAKTRQRENVGEVRALGVEADARWHPVPQLTLSASYALTRSRVVSSPANPALVGQRLPSTPLHRGAVTGRLELPGLFRFTTRVWAESLAYSDDRSAFRLPAFAQLDFSLARPLNSELELQANLSNALDSRIVTAASATMTNVAAPRTVWLSLRGSYQGL